MPDITMCASETCSVRTNCYRSRASGTVPTEYRQSWFLITPERDGPTCDYYWIRGVPKIQEGEDE